MSAIGRRVDTVAVQLPCATAVTVSTARVLPVDMSPRLSRADSD